MDYFRNCPSCGSVIEYTTNKLLSRAIKSNSLCKKCACLKMWESSEIRKKASESRKKYIQNLSDSQKSNIANKISETNKKIYSDKSEVEKKSWKDLCSSNSKKRWEDQDYKDRLKKILSEKNWSKRDDAKEIKEKQVKSRIKNNGGIYSKGPGRCKEFEVSGLKCYGTFEKKYIEILISRGMDVPKKPDSSISTEYGSYTPDFEFKDFYVEVKSPFTYDVLMGRASYSKERDSNPDQLKKMIYVSKNVKKIMICIVDGEFLNYLDL
jgi:hypothetical protein